jgi:hypothetical protein
VEWQETNGCAGWVRYELDLWLVQDVRLRDKIPTVSCLDWNEYPIGQRQRLL